MAISIKQVRIQNFRPFEDFSVAFSSPNMVVFDGPNGFGKTSFYDAIELLFTGRLRRYKDLVENAFDKRQSANGSPLLNDRSKGDLIIKGELENDGERICLMRVGKQNKLSAVTRMDDINLKLYSVPQFDSDDRSPIQNESEYLTALLGKDYIRNFQFLNYIEQEENLYLLKRKDKDRKDAITHLFNTTEFEDRINKLTEVSKKIVELCGTPAQRSLESKEGKLKALREKLTGEVSPVQFTQLIPWKKIVWDNEKLEFQGEQYVEWLGENGKLAQLSVFLESIDEFRKDLKNKKLDSLLKDEALVVQLLFFWNFIESAEDFSKKLALNKSIINLLQALEKGVLYTIEQGKVDLPPQLQKLIESEIDVQAYSDSIIRIRGLQKSANTLSKLLADIKDSRKAFIEKFMKY